MRSTSAFEALTGSCRNNKPVVLAYKPAHLHNLEHMVVGRITVTTLEDAAA